MVSAAFKLVQQRFAMHHNDAIAHHIVASRQRCIEILLAALIKINNLYNWHTISLVSATCRLNRYLQVQFEY